MKTIQVVKVNNDLLLVDYEPPLYILRVFNLIAETENTDLTCSSTNRKSVMDALATCIQDLSNVSYKLISPTNTKICALCGNAVVIRQGAHGPFYGCSSYPDCTYSANVLGRLSTHTVAELKLKKDREKRKQKAKPVKLKSDSLRNRLANFDDD